MELIKVSARSRSTAVAGAIAGVIREVGYAEVQAIGASAVNQAIKAAAIARGYLQEDGIIIACIPVFTEVDIHGLERTAIKLMLWTVEQDSLPQRVADIFAAEKTHPAETSAPAEEVESNDTQ